VVTELERVFREEWGRVLAALIGFLGDFDVAEEATQEAFAIAAERWPREGIPASPRAWLVTAARNRAIDRIRRDRTLASKLRLLDVPEAMEDEMDETTIPDERLELLFTCCHPALALEAQVALTLRTLGGLRTDEIAPRVPRPRGDDGEAARACEAEDPRRRDSVSRAAAGAAARPARGRVGGRLPHLQRGLRRSRRPGGRGDQARERTRGADAG
jgi:DNA-directed RNA polymerase specialized sigma24 family protein